MIDSPQNFVSELWWPQKSAVKTYRNSIGRELSVFFHRTGSIVKQNQSYIDSLTSNHSNHQFKYSAFETVVVNDEVVAIFSGYEILFFDQATFVSTRKRLRYCGQPTLFSKNHKKIREVKNSGAELKLVLLTRLSPKNHTSSQYPSNSDFWCLIPLPLGSIRWDFVQRFVDLTIM